MAPCMGCADRTPGCHCECDRYKHLKTDLENEKTKEQEEINTSAALRRLYFNRLKKQRSLRRKKD